MAVTVACATGTLAAFVTIPTIVPSLSARTTEEARATTPMLTIHLAACVAAASADVFKRKLILAISQTEAIDMEVMLKTANPQHCIQIQSC
jgi:hypothetical protein